MGRRPLPDRREAEQLNQEEDNFLERMGDRAILAARVTVPGSRTWHFVSRDFEKMRPRSTAGRSGCRTRCRPDSQRRLKIDGGQDMTWEFLRDLGLR